MAQDMFFDKNYSLNGRGDLIDLSTPRVMGILNITPDSFYRCSRVSSKKGILDTAKKMISEGADILDLGAYSTRPGADDISVEEEIDRLIPAVEAIRAEFPRSFLSADTFRSKVAKAAVEAGADMINDVSGGNLDPEMFQTVANLSVPYVLMHMRGTPQTMKSKNNYANLLQEVIFELAEKHKQLTRLGVKDIIVDPGFGFAKNIQQNFELLNHLQHFHQLNAPLLIGISRKSMIYKTLETTPDEALYGTITLNTLALQKGAHILRVHDVKPAADAIKMMEQLNRYNGIV